jgi:hypothetical protein
MQINLLKGMMLNVYKMRYGTLQSGVNKIFLPRPQEEV